jgi:hypothetical protein
MRNIAQRMNRKWIHRIAAVSLTMLCSMGTFSVSSAQAPDAVCVLRLVAEGEVLGVLVDVPQNFNIAVALPSDKDVNVPVPCDQLNTLGLAVTNQKNTNVNFAVQVFTHQGNPICTKGPFLLPVNGGTGVTFTDCQP